MGRCRPAVGIVAFTRPDLDLGPGRRRHSNRFWRNRAYFRFGFRLCHWGGATTCNSTATNFASRIVSDAEEDFSAVKYAIGAATNAPARESALQFSASGAHGGYQILRLDGPRGPDVEFSIACGYSIGPLWKGGIGVRAAQFATLLLEPTQARFQPFDVCCQATPALRKAG